MKKSFYILLLISSLGGLVLSGCQKTYESVPLGQQITLDLAFDPRDSLGKQAMVYLLTTYQQVFYNEHNRVSGNYMDAASDDAISSASGIPAVQAIATGAYSASQPNADDQWTRDYAAIRNATIFIVYINRVPLNELLPNGQPARAAYRSEARFLRAWLYFDLLKRYGGIPLLGDSIRQITDNVQLPRNSFSDCVNYIVSECDNIKDSLRTAAMVNSSTYGRITQGAAMTLKSQVLLYAASPLFNGGNIDGSNPLTGYPSFDGNRWKLAADAAKAVMDLGAYSLMPSFNDVFVTQAAPVGPNTESICWKQVGSPGTSVETANAPVGFTSAGGNGITSPTQNLVDAYTTDSGYTITDPNAHYNSNNPYANRDPRLSLTVFHNGSLWLNRTVQTYDGGIDKPGGSIQQTKTSYYMRKFMGAFESVTSNPPSYAGTYHDFIYYRYAGVLLNYAEATNEFSGPSAEVYNVLYALRKRAGILTGPDNTYGVPQGISQDSMRTVIRNERRVEMAFEEQRFWDIRRWKIAAQVYNDAPLKGMDIQVSSGGQIFYNLVPVLTTIFRDPQMYLYPIPYSEVIKNSQMKQNPLW
ncbi:MAG TPA: RagB/SusD family nutrient uptake outer membrane protein [Puia sp.]|nr:RagB/SusD family nutrient uptake outer membrane protein [Puia sp.]